MSHLNPDELTLLALHDGDAGIDQAHLTACAACADELRRLRELVSIGRETQDVRDLPAPPDRLWEAIAEEAFAAGSTPSGDRVNGTAWWNAEHTTTYVAAGSVTRPRAPHQARFGGTVPSPQVLAQAQPTRVARWRTALVAGVAALLGILGTLTASWLTSEPSSPPVLATADLRPQDPQATGAFGTAELLDLGKHRGLRITVTGMPATQGLYQIWLYDGKDRMIALGSIGDGSVVVPVPDNASSIEFTIVDISAQQLGQQQHGTSMLQGRLT